MTERERRPGSGGAEDNMRDELDEAAERGRSGKDASKEAVEEEEQTGGYGRRQGQRRRRVGRISGALNCFARGGLLTAHEPRQS